MDCRGIDLTHPEWILAEAVDDREELKPRDGTATILNGGQSLWKDMEQALLLRNFRAAIPNVQQDLVRPLLEGVNKQFNQTVFGASQDPLVAFAFPYQTPPLIRKSIHFLLTQPIIGRNDRRPNRSAIEAPIAFVLACIWKEKIQADKPSRVLLLTGVAPRLELTAVALSRSDRTLQIEVTDYVAINPNDILGSLSHFGGYDDHDGLFQAGNPPEAHAIKKELEKRFGPCDVVVMDEQAVALGAILHGSLLQNRQFVGQQINDLRIARTAPVAVGVLGTNKANEWFWRRVIEKGKHIADMEPWSAGLSTGAPAPERLALAECPRPDYAARRWLIQDDWAAAGLRWHEVITNDKALDDWDLRLRMRPIPKCWNGKSFFCPHWDIQANAC